jgi:MerR family mercuric resistance operon transcriptional regulator
MSEDLTIGGLARAAGVNVETIRYYHRRRLVAEPYKPPGGHRRYASSAVSRVRFIKRAQYLGFTLEEVTQLLQLEDGKSCGETRLLAQQKLAQIEERIADLDRIRRRLNALIADCAKDRNGHPCPIIATLSAGATDAPQPA